MKDYRNDSHPAMIDEHYNKFVGSEPKAKRCHLKISYCSNLSK